VPGSNGLAEATVETSDPTSAVEVRAAARRNPLAAEDGRIRRVERREAGAVVRAGESARDIGGLRCKRR
jgi:hypothetical protein